MRFYDGIAAAADDVREFVLTNQGELPEHVRDKLKPLTGTGTSPVDLIVNFTEAVYANRDALPKEALEIAAGAADLIEANGYHGKLDDRASGISLALRRDSGEKVGGGRKWPEKDKDPSVRDAFVAPPPPEPEEEPAAGAAEGEK